MTECIIWDGPTNADGYGMTWLNPPDGGPPRRERVHRAVYELLVGPIPAGREIDHLCGVRACANVKHLEAVTHGENVRRGRSANREKTHCPYGHSLADAYIRKSGKAGRVCRPCAISRATEWRKRRG